MVSLRTPSGNSCCAAVTSATDAFTLNVTRSAGTFQLSVAVGGPRLTKTVRID